MYPGMCDDRVGCGAAGLSGESNRRLEMAIEIPVSIRTNSSITTCSSYGPG